MGGGFEYTRFTLFHVIWLMALTAGAAAGAVLGGRWFGTAGAVIIGLVGLAMGQIAASWVEGAMHRLSMKQLARSSNEELWAVVAAPEWKFWHTMALLQLAARDQNVRGELPRILEMLESDSELTRRFGWDALRIVFTEEMQVIPDYDPRGTTDDCRRQAAVLRAMLSD